MTKIYLVANWKLYVSARRSVTLARTIARRYGAKRFRRLTQILCPSDPILEEVGKALHHSEILLGAQNIGRKIQGAATGEISARDLEQLGCRFALVGHSERRALGETDAIIAEKLQLAAASGLVPILCVGEPATVRTQNRHLAFIESQLRRALVRFRGTRLLIAYEPLWAISRNGKSHGACSPKEADSMRRVILRSAKRHRKEGIVKEISLLYGGSVTGRNISAYVSPGAFDGALVGFASTKVGEYGTMIRILTGG